MLKLLKGIITFCLTVTDNIPLCCILVWHNIVVLFISMFECLLEMLHFMLLYGGFVGRSLVAMICVCYVDETALV